MVYEMWLLGIIAVLSSIVIGQYVSVFRFGKFIDQMDDSFKTEFFKEWNKWKAKR